MTTAYPPVERAAIVIPSTIIPTNYSKELAIESIRSRENKIRELCGNYDFIANETIGFLYKIAENDASLTEYNYHPNDRNVWVWPLIRDHYGKLISISLSESLKVNSSLTSLNLRALYLADEGVTALAEALMVNRSVTSLNLVDNDVEAAGAVAIAQMLQVNCTLKDLNLNNNSKIKDASAAIAEALKVNTSLTTLNVAGTNLGDITGLAFVEALKVNSALTSLSINNAVSLETAKAFADVLTIRFSLKEFNPPSVPTVAKESDSPLYISSDIGKFNTVLADVQASVAEKASVRFFRQQQALAFAAALQENTSVTNLSLSYNSDYAHLFGSIHMADVEIINAIKCNDTLTELSLYHFVGDSGAVILSNILKDNHLRKLQRLCLEGPELGDEGLIALAEALQVNEGSLTTLMVVNSSMGLAGMTALTAALNLNERLTNFILNKHSSFADDRVLSVFAEFLAQNHSLTALDLQDNNISGDSIGFIALVNALKVNTAVTRLNLSGNSLGATGATILAEALKTNKSVKDLELCRNNIQDEGAIILAEVIKWNKVMTNVTLRDNDVTEAGSAALEQILASNNDNIFDYHDICFLWKPQDSLELMLGSVGGGDY